MKESSDGWETPRWNALFVVCKDCRKRKNGPDELKPGKVLRALRSHTREAKPRPRGVLCGCLGLCPKGATAVAFAGHDGGLAIIAVETVAQLESALARLDAR